MGEVYRATDTVLKRQVALKILPPAVANDPERVARFQREAEVLASLNHPNIAHLYGIERSNATLALVMELVEGPTLADRIAKRPVPLDEALPIAKQIAEGLEAAHEQGIIHRDLKPANIKVRDDGTVKVLDFGLAKLAEPEGRSGLALDLSQSPTITSPAAMTGSGVILGTAAYMSPEQAKGQAVDKRSDVWSFGCVLYEMLAGGSIFGGDTVGEVVGAVLLSEPDWSRLPAATPDAIQRLLRRCLQKERKRRLQSIGDARVEIEEWQREPHARPPAVPRASRFGAWLPWSVLALVTLAALAQTIWLRRAPETAPREVRFEIATPTTTDAISLSVSPDSSKIVFVATCDSRPCLWLRSLDAVATRPLAGTDNAFYPFWSPDSRSIAFFASGRLNRLDLETGLVRPLAIAPNPLGGSWNRDDTILFTPNFTGPIFRVAATGGDPEAVTHMEPGQASHMLPQALPDGRRFLYLGTGNASRRVYVGDLGGGAAVRLLDADAPAVYGSGQLLFIQQGTLFSQPFDPTSATLSGRPIAIAEQVPVDATSGLAPLSASASGAVVYRSGAAGSARQFIWFDRSGRELLNVGQSDRTVPQMSLSPEDRRLAFSRSLDGNTDIWTLDLVRGVPSRLTFDPGSELQAVWSPNGSRIAFNSNRSGVFDLYLKSATDTPDELLLATPQNKAPNDWSLDGQFLLYRSPSLTTGFDIWALPMDGDRKPFPVVQTPYEERDGQFSPDGNWIAYQSNASGNVEIYIQPFRGGNREPVSTHGGAQVRWRRDGKELFYIALDGRLMAVPIEVDTAAKKIRPGVPTPLFATSVGGAIQGSLTHQYAVAADGQRFLMSTISEVRTPAITVILNWKPKPGARE
jgi:eukaryotic-like serine/threonine-protein kinase